jgi:tetratricopeptide (TPR) repeat protein
MELPKEQEFEILPADKHAAQAIDIDVTMDHSDNPQGVDATIVVAPDGLGSSQGTESPRDKEKSKGPATFPRKSQNLLGEASIEQNLSMNLDVVGDDVDRSAEELYKDSQVDVTENTRKLEQIEEIVVSGGSPAKDSDISPEGDVSEEVDSSVAEHSRHASEAVSIASEGTMVLSNKAPKMVKALDDVNGICKGDILISLVHCKESDGSGSPKGSVQIRDAVWRMRAMRRRFACIEIGQIPSKSTSLTDSPSKVSPTRNGRRSLPVDVDNMRVVDSMAQTRALEEGVVDHLHHDEFEDAIDLCKEIVSAYEDSFKQKEQHRSEEGNGRNSRLDSKPFFGNALHNMGIIYLLKQNYKRALSCFEGAAENRQPNDETPNSDYLTTLVKISLCNYALEDFSKAHKGLESCLESAKGYCKTITDFVQVAEILNNLGCLYFMCSQPETAARLFKESLDVQQSLLSHSLYGGSVLAGNASTLNMSVTRGNMAFLCMCANDHASAIFGLERALAAQQALLFDEHETLIGTMDHLAAANVLGGNKDKAISMLERMLRAQIHAYGSSDRRCDNTRSKIRMVMSKIGSRSGAELSTFIETINRQSPVVKQQAQPKSGKPRLLQKLSSSLRKKQ